MPKMRKHAWLATPPTRTTGYLGVFGRPLIAYDDLIVAIRYPISLWLSGSEELAVGATGTVCLGGYPCRRSRRDRERTLSGRGNGYPDSEYNSNYGRGCSSGPASAFIAPHRIATLRFSPILGRVPVCAAIVIFT